MPVVVPAEAELRRLVLVLGDQLHDSSPAQAGIDPARDRVLMIEAPGEARVVWSHRARIALFLAAMRHHAAALAGRGIPVDYVALDDPRHAAGPDGLVERLEAAIARWRPAELHWVEPGEWRLERAITALCERLGLRSVRFADPHFLCSRERFAAWAARQKTLRMEFFYRRMRIAQRVLVDEAGNPEGGRWNFDADNRSGFPAGGPGETPPPPSFAPDPITREVLALVERRFPDHPGSLEDFGWPVTRAQARAALDHFVATRLASFGRWQDAMWTGMPFGWHSLLSSSLNLKLLDPREAIDAAVRAWRDGAAPLASVEGFVRQVLGWREFVRGVYWLDMPGLAEANHHRHDRPLPGWFWTGDTGMACLRACIGQTLRWGYAHHIQRLMVIGNFAQLAGLAPRAVSDWFLAVYVDAVEWVELPNVAGMALHANGGRFTSKPYAAGGAYIDRMSNYCAGCRYRPRERSGPRACPFTVLYWRFLDANRPELAANPRTALMAASVARMGDADRARIRELGESMLARIEAL